MYGYVKTYRPELKCRELDAYQAAYCGLCRALGQCTGQCSRLTLSYDMTFFALFRMALTGEEPVTERRRCPVHPLKKRPMLVRGDALTQTAVASALLLWHQLEDDRADERGAKRVRAVLAGPIAAGARRRACRTVISAQTPSDAALTGSGMDARIAECMQALTELEGQKPQSVDIPAQLFGELMGDILSFGLDGSGARLAREIGIRTGRWVYILDAADDYAEDRRRGRYNPFLCLYGEDAVELPEERRREILAALDMETDAILRALDLVSLPDRDMEGILRNILSEGMPRTARSILFPPEKRSDADAKTQEGSEQT
ncbi:MAG: DUF5685 family protein [Clostridia bacterium]|nr:DUF5685 family protein [Clostridia bacterium]